MFVRPVLLGLLAGPCLFLLTALLKTPHHDLDWQDHLAITPSAVSESPVWTVAPVRDWTYDASGPIGEGWIDTAEIDTEAVQRVWLVLEPHPGIPMMAHTLVLFEFETGELIGLTIEARKERHEKFAPIRGALNRFELIYVWASPRDLLLRRAVYLGHELEIYPLDLSEGEARAFLTALLERTAALHAAPRFYNTLVSNCTNELAKTADLAWDPAFVLTGGAARALHARRRIAGADFEAVRMRAISTDTVIALDGLPSEGFDAALLEGLTAVWGAP